MTAPGVIIAAPASGSGKTIVTLGLLRALRRRGLRVSAAKSGPDYIDPAFHAAASGGSCCNLDPWAMRPDTIAGLISALGAESDLVLCEGAMGLFDGVDARGTGSCADLAAMTGWPVVLVVDVRGQAASVAALVAGFARHRPDVTIAGVIFNRGGGERHAAILAGAVAAATPAIRCLGTVPRDAALALPERHLGLVQARERRDLDGFIAGTAARIGASVDLDALVACARRSTMHPPDRRTIPVPPLGQRIAVAIDDAFAFVYPALLDGWRSEGAEVTTFSPLADEAPPADADAIYLPGGYPELHAGRLAAAARFMRGLSGASARGAAIYGECGGYMVLGRSLVDGAGIAHPMAGLLPLTTSFAARRLHLGYRTAKLFADLPLGDAGTKYRGHEFHYAVALDEGVGEPLFEVFDATEQAAGSAGRRVGRVMGSFIHLIDRSFASH